MTHTRAIFGFCSGRGVVFCQVVSLGESEGVIGGYVHGAMGPGVGKNAALVALKLGERNGRREREA